MSLLTFFFFFFFLMIRRPPRSTPLSLHDALPISVRAGVRGFVLKTQAGEDLAQAIEQGARGGFYVGAGVAQAVVEGCRAAAAAGRGRLASPGRPGGQLVARGKSAEQVAGRLAVTPKDAA